MSMTSKVFSLFIRNLERQKFKNQHLLSIIQKIKNFELEKKKPAKADEKIPEQPVNQNPSPA